MCANNKMYPSNWFTCKPVGCMKADYHDRNPIMCHELAKDQNPTILVDMGV